MLTNGVIHWESLSLESLRLEAPAGVLYPEFQTPERQTPVISTEEFSV
jgi:hypothetical protein